MIVPDINGLAQGVFGDSAVIDDLYSTLKEREALLAACADLMRDVAACSTSIFEGTDSTNAIDRIEDIVKMHYPDLYKESTERFPLESPEYQEFLADAGKRCRCSGVTICGGVLAGGMCDEL